MSEILPQLAGENIDEDRLRDYITTDLQKEKTSIGSKKKAKVELVPEGSLAPDDEEEEEDTEEEATES